MAGGVDVDYDQREYQCRVCGQQGPGHNVLQKSPPTFLIDLGRSGTSSLPYWEGVLKEQFPNHPKVVGGDLAGGLSLVKGTANWINALLPSIIWLGAAAIYAYVKKPAGVSFLAVRTDALGWLGVGVLGAGFALHCWSVVVMAGHGKAATLAVTGPYRFVRNPIYLAGITLLAGVGLLYGSWHVADLAMAVALFVYFHFAVILVEEPALRRRFGARYIDYCQRVPRWLPRLVPGGP